MRQWNFFPMRMLRRSASGVAAAYFVQDQKRTLERVVTLSPIRSSRSVDFDADGASTKSTRIGSHAHVNRASRIDSLSGILTGKITMLESMFIIICLDWASTLHCI